MVGLFAIKQTQNVISRWNSDGMIVHCECMSGGNVIEPEQSFAQCACDI